MESTEHLQRQLTSLDELRTIAKTMKALSAASIRQYERAVAALGHQARTVELGLRVVLQWREREGVGSVYVFHNRPLGGGRYRLMRMRLLPVDTEQLGLQQAAERNLEDRLGEVTADTA